MTSTPQAFPQAVLCDRDGTLIREEHFLGDPDRVSWVPGALNLLQTLYRQGSKVLIVSNQSGVARGYFGVETVEAIHDRLRQDARRSGATIDGIYYCPHHPEGTVQEYSLQCNCRKPKPGLFLQAIQDHNLQPGQCWVVGDRLRDLEPGIALGMKAFLVLTGYGHQDRQHLAQKTYVHQVTVITSIADLCILLPSTYAEIPHHLG